MRKQRVPQPGRRAGRSLRGKILRNDRAGKAAHAKKRQHKALPEDIARIAGRDADVDDIRHDERHEQLERRFQQLEKRR